MTKVLKVEGCGIMAAPLVVLNRVYLTVIIDRHGPRS